MSPLGILVLVCPDLLYCSSSIQQGMAVGYASAGGTAIGEIQFGDYIL